MRDGLEGQQVPSKLTLIVVAVLLLIALGVRLAPDDAVASLICSADNPDGATCIRAPSNP